ncbi:MAG: ATP-dependent helicase [Desulfobacteraceae bacterium]|nr:MAG: ATP-dependent helicase [Desulfobacteraceae bacterium]
MNEIQLNPQQQEAVSHKEGPMIVLSVAGSGKTMVLTERIIHLIEEGVDPSRLLAITFAKKAVLEIQSRLEKRLNGNGNKALVCTFHSLGYRILKRENSLGIGCRLVQEADQLNLIRQALERVRLEDDPADIMRKVSLAKNDLVSPADLEGSTKPEEKNLAKVYSCYELLKRRKRLLDFDDLLYLPYHLFKAHAGILARYQNRFRQILIDEFQDSSKVMVELVKLLSQSHRNVWLAGDDDQSIHGFRGARSEIFVSFEKEYGANAKTITMAHNYRSTGKIIRAANNLIAHNKKRVIKEMTANNGDGEDIEILEGEDEYAEAEAIAKRINDLIEERYRYGEIAILARLYRLMPLIEGALIKEKIPYNSSGGFLYDRQDVKTMFSVIKFLFGGDGEYLDQKLLKTIRSELYEEDEEVTLRSALEIASLYVLKEWEGTEDLDEDEKTLKKSYLDAFEYLVAPYQNLDELLEHMEDAGGVNGWSPDGRVSLMTIHQAKGLEFKCVIIPGANEGILPHVNSIEQVILNLEEERRLMYVAMTRAMERLIITYRKRQEGQAITAPSRFVQETSITSVTISD